MKHSTSGCWDGSTKISTASCSCGWQEVIDDERDSFEMAWRRHLAPLGLLTRQQRMEKRDVVNVFSNGTEYMIWQDRNCARCAKGYDEAKSEWRCPLEKAIGEAMFDEDAAMDRELAMRAGLSPGRRSRCPEFERDWSVA